MGSMTIRWPVNQFSNGDDTAPMNSLYVEMSLPVNKHFKRTLEFLGIDPEIISFWRSTILYSYRPEGTIQNQKTFR